MRESYRSTSPDETFALGKALGAQLQAHDCVCLRGELGAGKTLFTKGVCVGLGVDPNSVSSPTFSIVNEYAGSELTLHCDFYRIENPTELINIGWDEYCERDAVLIIEWPERAEELLPTERIDVSIVAEQPMDSTSRTLTIDATKFPRHLNGIKA